MLGLGLVGLGIFMLAGRTITVNLPKLSKGTDSRELSSVFLFGISYALVSLSCTLPLFTAAVSVTARGESVFVEIGAHLAYALGMGLVLMVLTLAIALARQSMVRSDAGRAPVREPDLGWAARRSPGSTWPTTAGTSCGSTTATPAPAGSPSGCSTSAHG